MVKSFEVRKMTMKFITHGHVSTVAEGRLLFSPSPALTSIAFISFDLTLYHLLTSEDEDN